MVRTHALCADFLGLNIDSEPALGFLAPPNPLTQLFRHIPKPAKDPEGELLLSRDPVSSTQLAVQVLEVPRAFRVSRVYACYDLHQRCALNKKRDISLPRNHIFLRPSNRRFCSMLIAVDTLMAGTRAAFADFGADTRSL